MAPIGSNGSNWPHHANFDQINTVKNYENLEKIEYMMETKIICTLFIRHYHIHFVT